MEHLDAPFPKCIQVFYICILIVYLYIMRRFATFGNPTYQFMHLYNTGSSFLPNAPFGGNVASMRKRL